MALPKVSHPTLPILVPSLKKAFRFRPFTVKEEKILLMAKESTEPEKDHLRAIHQVVNNCSVDPTLEIDSLAQFDLEWLFLKTRAMSVGNKIPQAFNDTEEKAAGLNPLPVYEFEIDLDMVKAPDVPNSVNGGVFTITLDSGDGVDLVYPPASLFNDPEFTTNTADAILYRSTKVIFTEDSRFYTRDVTMADVIEYYDGWSTKDMEKVRAFLDDVPTMLYECHYKNSYGHDRTIKLTSLTDFFIF
jgi:hypothetical protein